MLIKFSRNLEYLKYLSRLMQTERKMIEKPCKYKTEDPEAIEVASTLLGLGKVIGLPTDTIYGLACNANDPKAIQSLYEIKGRDENKPVAICVSEIEDLKKWGKASHLPDALLKKLLPGPVTIVLKKTRNLNNPYLNPGTEKIGIRIPDFDFIRNICKKFKEPIALTSANRSSEPSSLTVEEFNHLWPRLGGVFDGGSLGVQESQRAGSSVIDLSRKNFYVIIRRGIAIDATLETLQEFGIEAET